jgi:hypothetical protein
VNASSGRTGRIEQPGRSTQVSAHGAAGPVDPRRQAIAKLLTTTATTTTPTRTLF